MRVKIGLNAEDGTADIVFTGALDCFEIWKKATYDAEMTALDDLGSGLVAGDEDILSLLGRVGAGA